MVDLPDAHQTCPMCGASEAINSLTCANCGETLLVAGSPESRNSLSDLKHLEKQIGRLLQIWALQGMILWPMVLLSIDSGTNVWTGFGALLVPICMIAGLLKRERSVLAANWLGLWFSGLYLCFLLDGLTMILHLKGGELLICLLLFFFVPVLGSVFTHAAMKTVERLTELGLDLHGEPLDSDS